MHTITLNANESTNKVAAFLDARTRSTIASTHYDYQEKAKADRMKLALELVYDFKSLYVTFRKKFIAIKIDSPTVKNTSGLQGLEQQWDAEGIVKVVTPQGITYRIPKV